MDLHRTPLKEVIMPKMKSVYVIDYYEGVHRLLESRHDFPYKNIFAKPRTRTKTEIIWSSDAFINQPTRLSDLQGEDKEYYSFLLCRRLEALLSLIETLKAEDGGEQLSELLSKAVVNVDDNSVYCGDDSIVIINWGLIPRQAALGGSGIYRSGGFVGGWDKAHHVNPRPPRIEFPPQDEVDVPDNGYGKSEDVEEQPCLVAEPSDIVSKTESAPFPTGHVEPTDPRSLAAERHHVEPDEPAREIDGRRTTETEIHAPVESTVTHETPVTQTVPEESGVEKTEKAEKTVDSTPDKVGRKPEYGWKRMLGDFWSGLCFLFRKLWWILLLLLLVLACLIGFRNCQGPLSQVNPFYSPLPERPVVMPVENGAVGKSEDGMSMVATDRLNIMLEKENDDTMLEWAKAFKKAYPSSDFEVKYYNKDTYMLQIKVPADSRLEVKKEIKSKLSDFDFDVFEETVFRADYAVNDPAMADPKASWYFKVIGAEEAWNQTQGAADVIVAVVDNGFDLSHPELAGKIVSPYNVLTQDADIRPIVTEEGVDPHGTHVAATAVGNANNQAGLMGMAPGCRLMPVQVGSDNKDGSMSSLAILEGVMYAVENGADVVNISLGMYLPDEVAGMSESQQLNYIASSFREDEAMWENIFRKAEEKDCIIVFAAGNDNVISGIDPKKRNSHTLRVSAVDPQMHKASFSNYGRYPRLQRDYSTVSAPGVAIYSAAPGNRYAYLQGTSMAAPIVSGTAALLRSANPNLTAVEVIDILQKTGTEVDPSIGPVINVGNAVSVALGKEPSPKSVDCDRVRKEMENLKARLDSLSKLCPVAAQAPDTLNYDDVIRDIKHLDGVWKSTTQLVSQTDQSPIELYMTFKNKSGQLKIIDKGKSYTAPLAVSIVKGEVHITQSAPATCPGEDLYFVPYRYECMPDRKRNLFCNATSETNKVSFNLVRIK